MVMAHLPCGAAGARSVSPRVLGGRPRAHGPAGAVAGADGDCVAAPSVLRCGGAAARLRLPARIPCGSCV
ncbi:hypothetical protein GCM10010406_47220 [Streptomyces thermolineatus]|uniref:Uncharacterized protein n=1 Tax=Streptomyces thermolineatus TaxID=44033 RepID=A0ABP5ZV52_9ACTN